MNLFPKLRPEFTTFRLKRLAKTTSQKIKSAISWLKYNCLTFPGWFLFRICKRCITLWDYTAQTFILGKEFSGKKKSISEWICIPWELLDEIKLFSKLFFENLVAWSFNSSRMYILPVRCGGTVPFWFLTLNLKSVLASSPEEHSPGLCGMNPASISGNSTAEFLHEAFKIYIPLPLFQVRLQFSSLYGVQWS